MSKLLVNSALRLRQKTQLLRFWQPRGTLAQSHLPFFALPSSVCISSRHARKRAALSFSGAERRRKRINSLVLAMVSVSANKPPRSRLIASTSFVKRVRLILSAVAVAGWGFLTVFILCVCHTMHTALCQSPRRHLFALAESGKSGDFRPRQDKAGFLQITADEV